MQLLVLGVTLSQNKTAEELKKLFPDSSEETGLRNEI